MKKLFLTICLISLLLPGTAFAACDCRCDFSGCPEGVAPTQRIGNLTDRADCIAQCEEYSELMGCSSVIGTQCMNGGGESLPGGEVGETPVTAPGGGDLVFEPPLGSVSIQEVIANVIRAVLGIVGSITLLMFIIGGFIWMTAAGNEDRIKLGRNILTWTILGLAVIFSAYAITEFILRSLLE